MHREFFVLHRLLCLVQIDRLKALFGNFWKWISSLIPHNDPRSDLLINSWIVDEGAPLLKHLRLILPLVIAELVIVHRWQAGSLDSLRHPTQILFGGCGCGWGWPHHSCILRSHCGGRNASCRQILGRIARPLILILVVVRGESEVSASWDLRLCQLIAS